MPRARDDRMEPHERIQPLWQLSSKFTEGELQSRTRPWTEPQEVLTCKLNSLFLFILFFLQRLVTLGKHVLLLFVLLFVMTAQNLPRGRNFHQNAAGRRRWADVLVLRLMLSSLKHLHINLTSIFTSLRPTSIKNKVCYLTFLLAWPYMANELTLKLIFSVNIRQTKTHSVMFYFAS